MRYDYLYLFLTCSFCLLTSSTFCQETDPHKIFQTEIFRLNKVAQQQIKTQLKTHRRLTEDLINLVGELYLDRELIFGKNDKYLNLGLHRHFKSPPIVPKAFYERDPRIISLEKKHRDLYYVDIDLSLCKGLESTLVNKPKIKAAIMDIENLTQSQIREKIIVYCIENISLTQAKLCPHIDDFHDSLLKQ